MGNSESTPPPEEPEEVTPPVAEEDDVDQYKWPENLFLETRDMAALSFLVYSFGYAVDVVRKHGLKGLEQTDDGRVNKTFDLPRSFTPSEILKIIEDNHDVLATNYPDTFDVENSNTKIITNLKIMQDRVIELGGGMSRPLTVEEYDDRHQQHELVYGITKDDINKRITLVFRGTDNKLAFGSNWTTNLAMTKTQGHVPSTLKDVIPPVESTAGGFYTTGGLWIHSGFYNYVFAQTKDEDDPVEFKKYDEILQDLKMLFESNPIYTKEYKLYVTGHSLGAALSTVVAFYLACEINTDAGKFLPSPITCINFASPRVGDGNFLLGVQHLEKQGLLRMLRIVNDNDSIAFSPMTNYHHVGFQTRLYKEDYITPILTYHTSKTESWDMYWDRMWNNSLPASFNLSYDHGDYRERVDQNEKFFEQLQLEKLYQDKSLTGF